MRKVVKKSQYILTLPLRGKGNVGDIIEVKPGFGRYLERYSKAERVTKDILSNIEIKKQEWIVKERANIEAGDKLFEQLQKVKSIVLQRKISQENHLYSAINKKEIIDHLNSKYNILVEKSHIIMNDNIKKAGSYPIAINVYGDKDYEVILEISAEIESSTNKA